MFFIRSTAMAKRQSTFLGKSGRSSKCVNLSIVELRNPWLPMGTVAGWKTRNAALTITLEGCSEGAKPPSRLGGGRKTSHKYVIKPDSPQVNSGECPSSVSGPGYSSVFRPLQGAVGKPRLMDSFTHSFFRPHRRPRHTSAPNA